MWAGFIVEAREAYHVWIRVWANSVVDMCTTCARHRRGRNGSDCSTRRGVDGDDVVDRDARRRGKTRGDFVRVRA